MQEAVTGVGTIESRVSYVGPMAARPRYHVNDASRDNLVLDPRNVRIENARLRADPPSLEREGFALFPRKCLLTDFGDPEEATRVHQSETERLLLELTHADEVVISSPAVRRSTRSARGGDGLTCSGSLYDTRPVGFVHIDISNTTAAAFSERKRPKNHRLPVRRFAHYNVWRVLSPPPQDMPLALCDSRTVSPSDLVEADAMMDIPGKREGSYVGIVVHYNPRHRWAYFPDMNSDEVLVFKTHDSDPRQPSQVPHAAFDNPALPSQLVPRVSIETRAIAYWFG